MKFKNIFMVRIFLFLLGSIASASASCSEDIGAASIDDSSLYDNAVIVSMDDSVLDEGSDSSNSKLKESIGDSLLDDVNAIDTFDEDLDESLDSSNSKLKDDGNDKNFTDLVNEIANANDGDEINITSDYYIGNETLGITITANNLTINGNNYAFYGGEEVIDFNFITVYGSNVVLKNLSFKNMVLNDSYNVIQWYGGEGTISSCIFSNNAAYYGGAIEWSGSDGLIENSEFSSNYALYDAGAIYVGGRNLTINETYFGANIAENNGGAIYMANRDYTIDSCTFEFNIAREGGAVYAYDNDGVVIHSFFSSNTADEGGAIKWIGNYGKISSSLFENNNATEAGALSILGSDVIVDNVTFVNNTADFAGAISSRDNCNLTTMNSSFYDNRARFGGAISSDSDIIILFSVFDNNQADFGGAVYSTEELQVANSTFKNNNASNYGGALYLDEGGEILSCEFFNNSAELAGAIFVSGDLNVTDTVFKDNVGKLYSSNNVISYDGTATLNNVSSDTPISLKLVEMSFISIKNNTYSYNTVISFNVTDSQGLSANPNATVLLKIDGKSYSANASSGIAVFKISNLNAGSHKYTAIYKCAGFMEYSLNGSFTINPLVASISAKSASYVINYGGKYSITLKDKNGKLIPSQKIIFILNGKTIGSAKTNSKGVATIKLTAKALKKAKAGTKKLVIKFNGNNYKVSSKTVKIKIKKEKTKINAKKKSFKRSKKVKKYTVTLRNSKNKPIKKVKLTLRVNGKTYKAKTNNKGQASFKLSKLKKLGKYTAVIRYAGNNYYIKSSRKVRITIKK